MLGSVYLNSGLNAQLHTQPAAFDAALKRATVSVRHRLIRGRSRQTLSPSLKKMAHYNAQEFDCGDPLRLRQ